MTSFSIKGAFSLETERLEPRLQEIHDFIALDRGLFHMVSSGLCGSDFSCSRSIRVSEMAFFQDKETCIQLVSGIESLVHLVANHTVSLLSASRWCLPLLYKTDELYLARDKALNGAARTANQTGQT